MHSPSVCRLGNELYLEQVLLWETLQQQLHFFYCALLPCSDTQFEKHDKKCMLFTFHRNNLILLDNIRLSPKKKATHEKDELLWQLFFITKKLML